LQDFNCDSHSGLTEQHLI